MEKRFSKSIWIKILTIFFLQQSLKIKEWVRVVFELLYCKSIWWRIAVKSIVEKDEAAGEIKPALF